MKNIPYEQPIVKILFFETQDVVRTSGVKDGDNDLIWGE